MSTDLFKYHFKYYKSRCPPPDLTEVIDFSKLKCVREDIKKISLDASCISNDVLSQYGLRPINNWDGFTLNRRSGIIYIRNPFFDIGQRLWISKCLRDYSRKPNKLNLDAHGDLNNSQDWWEACNTNNNITDNVLQKKLRWSTLGYHHDWDTKVYTEENRHSFPDDLAEMCKIIAELVGFKDFIPQASIVNYYHMDSTLAAHTDHSEVNLEAPLISISFGQSAIFLIGGETKETKPQALFLHSGDILIMSKESRLCYHAVPRIIPAHDQPWNSKNLEKYLQDLDGHKISIISNLYDESYWEPYRNYLTSSRINLNVRQVLFKNQSSIDNNR